MPVTFNILHWFSAVALIMLSFYCFHRASTKIGLYLCIFLLLLAGWCLTAALAFSVPDLHDKIEISRIKFLFIPGISVCVLFFSRSFSDQERLSIPSLIGIFFVPIGTIIIASSPYNEFLITHYQLKNLFGYPLLTFENGPWFTVHAIHSRIMVVWALLILAKTANTNHLIKRMTWVMFFSILIPFTIDSIAIYLWPAMRFIQLVPVALLFTGICFYYVVFKDDILELVPIARGAVIDSIPEIYLVIDYRERLVDFNLFAKRAFDLDKKSYGKILKSINPDKDGILEHLLDMLKNKKNESEIIINNHGQAAYYAIKCENILNTTSQQMGKVIVVKNITEQKNYERQLKLTVEMRTKFISIMAHDLVGNVSGHTLFLESLLDHAIVEKDPDLKASLDFLLHSSQITTKFVEGLLSWSKENLENIQLKKTKADLHFLISDSIQFLQPIAIQKDIEYALNVPVNTLVDVDPNMIQTVIRNILANAIKLSPVGSLVVINAEVTPKSIAVHIIDQGPGVNEVEINTFLNGLNIESYKGGFGLTLCRDFIHLHKGEIKVKNNHPIGATFSFNLSALNY